MHKNDLETAPCIQIKTFNTVDDRSRKTITKQVKVPLYSNTSPLLTGSVQLDLPGVNDHGDIGLDMEMMQDRADLELTMQKVRLLLHCKRTTAGHLE